MNKRSWIVAPAILALVALAGCATTKPLAVVCVSCSLLQASGLCADASPAGKVPTVVAPRLACPADQHIELVNYQRWLDGEEAPRVECRRYTIQ